MDQNINDIYAFQESNWDFTFPSKYCKAQPTATFDTVKNTVNILSTGDCTSKLTSTSNYLFTGGTYQFSFDFACDDTSTWNNYIALDYPYFEVAGFQFSFTRQTVWNKPQRQTFTIEIPPYSVKSTVVFSFSSIPEDMTKNKRYTFSNFVVTKFSN